MFKPLRLIFYELQQNTKINLAKIRLDFYAFFPLFCQFFSCGFISMENIKKDLLKVPTTFNLLPETFFGVEDHFFWSKLCTYSQQNKNTSL